MSERSRGAAWTETSKADVAGNVPKVAQELDKKIKGKYSGNLSLRIEDNGNKFSYSAEIMENNKVKIKNKFTLCEIGRDVYKPPFSCRKCSGCESNERLRELGNYLKSYNIDLKISAET